MKLTEYMKKVERIYKDAAPEYIKLAKQYDQIRQDIADVPRSRELTHEGKQKRIQALEEDKARLKAKMDKMAAEADEQAMKVRQEVEDRFYSHFYATPSSLDMQAIELLKSGILNDKELMHMANSFKGNATMLRICGQYMQNSSDKNIQQMGRAMQYAPQNTHMECLDAVIVAGRACVGIGTQSGPSGAESFLNRFDRMTEEAYANAPDVEG